MKKVKSFMLPYNAPSYAVTIFALVLAVAYCVVFFLILQDMPDMVARHWSAEGGFNNYGPKSGLYPVGIIPLGIAVVVFPFAWILVRKDCTPFVHILNGISLFSTCIMILAAVLMLQQPG